MSAEPAYVEPEATAPNVVPLALVQPAPGASSPWPVIHDGSSQIMVVAPPAAPLGKYVLLVAGLALGLGFMAGWVGWLVMAPTGEQPGTPIDVSAPAAVVATSEEPDVPPPSEELSLVREVQSCAEDDGCEAEPDPKTASAVVPQESAEPTPRKPARVRKPRTRKPAAAPIVAAPEPAPRKPKPAPKAPRFEKLDEGLREMGD